MTAIALNPTLWLIIGALMAPGKRLTQMPSRGAQESLERLAATIAMLELRASVWPQGPVSEPRWALDPEGTDMTTSQLVEHFVGLPKPIECRATVIGDQPQVRVRCRPAREHVARYMEQAAQLLLESLARVPRERPQSPRILVETPSDTIVVAIEAIEAWQLG